MYFAFWGLFTQCFEHVFLEQKYQKTTHKTQYLQTKSFTERKTCDFFFLCRPLNTFEKFSKVIFLFFTREDKSFVLNDVVPFEFEIAKRKRRRNARLQKKNKSLKSLCAREGRGWSFSHSIVPQCLGNLEGPLPPLLWFPAPWMKPGMGSRQALLLHKTQNPQICTWFFFFGFVLLRFMLYLFSPPFSSIKK